SVSMLFHFTIPLVFFRPFDGLYLPIGVTFGILVACGLGATMARVSSRARTSAPVAAAALAVAVVPAAQLWNNWAAHDASQRYFARDYAANALLSLPPNPIYFTLADHDTL